MKKSGIFPQKLKKSQKKQIRLLLFSAALLIISAIIIETIEPNKWISLALIMPAYLLAGGKSLLKAAKNALRGELFDETFLMSVASIGALALTEYFEAVAVMLFAGVGELFESVAVSGARSAIRELAKLCPDTVNLCVGDQITNVSADAAKVGDIFVVNAGERIALDGTVVEGNSSLDLSMLTGESLPVDVCLDDRVSAGSINLRSTLKIRADKVAGESFAARILRLVEDAASKKSKTESVITRFSLWYTPTVCALAAIMAFIMPLFFGGYAQSFAKFSYIALEFLVVSCPCALIISVPMTFFGAIGGAAKQGILFKSNSAPETMAKMSVCVFDKTGTLTNGVFSVQKLEIAGNSSEKELLETAFLLENGSTHPIARAILQYIDLQGMITMDSPPSTQVQESAGLGRILESDGRLIALAGNEALLQKHGIIVPKDVDSFYHASVVHIANAHGYMGSFWLKDQPKENAGNGISELENSRITCVMLSGDSEKAVKSVANELGIKEFSAELLPADKLSLLEEYLKNSKGRVAFVGDGINDAPALARADVGIAMGAMGSDAAIEAADLVIADDDVSKVAKAHKISKKTLLIAKQNIAFAILVKLLVMALCAVGIFNMWGAVFADVGVSVLAILNAMRTLNTKN